VITYSVNPKTFRLDLVHTCMGRCVFYSWKPQSTFTPDKNTKAPTPILCMVYIQGLTNNQSNIFLQ